MSINFGKTEVIGKSKFAPVYIAIILKESLLSTFPRHHMVFLIKAVRRALKQRRKMARRHKIVSLRRAWPDAYVCTCSYAYTGWRMLTEGLFGGHLRN